MKYPINLLCKLLGVNRSGYYKWLSRKGTENNYAINRRTLIQLLQETHGKHKTWGYHRLARQIRKETGWKFSDNFAHKCCKQVGIRAVVRKRKQYVKGKESIYYPNLLQNVGRALKPMQVVVSDMTVLKTKKGYYEWTLIIDTFNNEIIAHSVSSLRGDSKPYYKCLRKLIQLHRKKGVDAPTVLHTDQGAVYSSRAFSQAHSNYNIIRSMSRVGNPTDNPIIEALNGWMKEELYIDFNLRKSKNIEKTLNEYVHYYNTERMAYALEYKSPIQYKNEQGF